MKLARVGAFVGALAVAASASVLTAAPASAHTKKFTPGCEGEQSTLKVSLWAYAGVQGDKQNRITVTVDGTTKLENNRGFGESFEYTYKVSGDVDHVFTVEVTAHDSEQYSFKEEGIEVPACVKEQPPAEEPPAEEPPVEEPPAEEPPAEEPPAEESSSVAAPPTTTEAPVVPIADEEEPLANTGASIAIPLVIGVVLLGGGAALLIAQRKRAARD